MAQLTGREHAAPAVSAARSTPLALGVFALTTAILGSIFAGFIVPSVGAGISLLAAIAFFGGLVQLLIGLWDLREEQTLTGTLFASSGGLLMMLGIIVAPSLGILTALGSATHAALGLFFLCWTIFAAIVFLSSLRMNIALVITLALLLLSYLLLTIGELTGGSATFLLIGGWLGIITGLVAWYTAFAALLTVGKGLFHLPM